ncbi:hypothetical protein GIB67_024430 [Kingdonia uniflora]|uniref:PAS domain-containing protein n=1 Tax=Kingdonia uniflora TaxID=39325 RepID=A0A7J7P5F6_9MAGN|nr:hypothetical protein GIB67_024430 [Kingdonia uniflora]
MLLRGALVGIVTPSPNIMDLVKCDGAALYYQKKFWLLRVTSTEDQIRDIASWLLQHHNDSTGLSTDSLVETGYPGAFVLGEEVCGMAAISITSKDFLFWFRSHGAKDIKWGGAKRDPKDKGDGRKMYPRSSFKPLQNEIMNDVKTIVIAPVVNERTQWVNELHIVTTEIVRLMETASVPILAVDVCGKVNGWNSKAKELTGLTVQHAIGKPLIDIVENDSVQVVKIMLSRDINQYIVGICFVGQDITRQKLVMDKYTRVRRDYIAIVPIPSALIPPIFMIDKNGRCSEWNESMQKLTGLKRDKAVKKGDKVVFGFFDKKDKYLEALLSVNERMDAKYRECQKKWKRLALRN